MHIIFCFGTTTMTTTTTRRDDTILYDTMHNLTCLIPYSVCESAINLFADSNNCSSQFSPTTSFRIPF